MSQNFRHPDILEIARQTGRVTVEGLAAHFDVTVQTIRRDLKDLANAGKLERVHGGAVLPSGVANIVYEERRRLNETAKKRIAQACAGAIPDGASVFLNIGTTTEAVARALLGHRRLMVVTNNLNAAEILSASPECEITLTGGRLRSEDGGLVGPLAARSVDQFRFDVAVLGCSALDAGGDLLDFDPQEVMVSQSALHRARRRLVVADRSKLRRPAPIRICSLAEIDALYTDASLPEALAAQCDGWDTAIVPPDPA